jgi:hypothetical protein
MGRYASDAGGGNFTPAPVGTHVARCVRLVDLGTQHGEYKGEPTRRNQVLVTWELPDEMIEIDGKEIPVTTSRFYTNSLGEKANLRRDLEGWRGRAFTEDELKKFDLMNILGKPCMITIVGGENGKTKVASVSGLPKRTECPDQINELFSFWLDEFDQEKFDSLSDGIKKIVEKSEEYRYMMDGGEDRQGYTPQTEPADLTDDDLPF